MKKQLLIVIACGIATVYGIVTYLKNKRENSKKQEIEKKELEDISIVDPYENLIEQKETVTSRILERHGAAVTIIKDTLSDEKDDVGESKHKVDFDEIDSNLDSLLNEE